MRQCIHETVYLARCLQVFDRAVPYQWRVAPLKTREQLAGTLAGPWGTPLATPMPSRLLPEPRAWGSGSAGDLAAHTARPYRPTESL